jgi:hypothetical protein
LPTFDGVCLRAVRLEAGRDVVALQAFRVEPVFERGAPSAVAEHVAVPDAFEQLNFVVASPAPGFEGEVGVGAYGAYGEGEYLELRPVIGGDGEPFGGRQLVVGIERRGVADGAALPSEDLSPRAAAASNLLGFGGGLSEKM